MTFNSIEKILARCDEDADCMIWRGGVNRYGGPRFADTSVRRVMWELRHGEIDKKTVVAVSCENRLCLNPAHLTLATRSEVLSKVCQRVDVKLRKKAANTLYGQTKMAKITMQIARDIRASDRTQLDWARELGVSTSLISKVQRNKMWVESLSVWQGLAR